MVKYTDSVAGKYGTAKSKILKMLWEGRWVLGDDILEAIGQSYYDRRIRELRDEEGWDIESGWATNPKGVKRPAYRLRSQMRGVGIKRPQIPAAIKIAVLEKDNYTCQICGASLRDKQNNPQVDHKIPLIRKGESRIENYQAICSNCNVLKRGICAKCPLPTCNNCYLAFPEKGANNLFINLTEQESEHLSVIAQLLKASRIEALRKIVRDALKK